MITAQSIYKTSKFIKIFITTPKVINKFVKISKFMRIFNETYKNVLKIFKMSFLLFLDLQNAEGHAEFDSIKSPLWRLVFD